MHLQGRDFDKLGNNQLQEFLPLQKLLMTFILLLNYVDIFVIVYLYKHSGTYLLTTYSVCCEVSTHWQEGCTLCTTFTSFVPILLCK